MNQANQKVVVQTANMTLISIRSAEISYFNTFFSSFGTQSALIIGFICGSISQVPGVDNPSGCNYFWIVLYWITSAICVAASVHVLVCTIFISVFGQGLALRGPLGSMVRAVEGMVVEQKQVLFSFIISMVAFGFQAIGMYWIMMDKTSAIASTIITLIGMYGWYHYSLRIYNRFNWNQLKTDYYNEDDKEAELNELEPTVTNRSRGKESGSNLSTGLLNNTDKKSKSPLSKFIPGMGKSSSGSAAGGSSAVKDNVSVASRAQNEAMLRDDISEAPFHDVSTGITVAAEVGGNSAESEAVSGGFITVKTSKAFSDPWERCYLVLRRTLLFYYKDKRAFQMNPEKPTNKRAIDLEGYTLVAGAVEPPYAISLIPADPDDIRKAWKFRCDTLAEFTNWIDTFSKALKLCESVQSQSDLVVMSGSQSVRWQGSQMGDNDGTKSVSGFN